LFKSVGKTGCQNLLKKNLLAKSVGKVYWQRGFANTCELFSQTEMGCGGVGCGGVLRGKVRWATVGCGGLWWHDVVASWISSQNATSSVIRFFVIVFCCSNFSSCNINVLPLIKE
jgi:hypothetical protein